MHFDHVGIATEDAAKLAEMYTDLFDTHVAHEETFDGMEVVFLSLGNGYLELLEPIESEGTIASYLDSDGAGIHHVGVATDDIGAALDNAREMGIDLIDEKPRDGAWGHDVAFLHPRDTGGVLVEFVEH